MKALPRLSIIAIAALLVVACGGNPSGDAVGPTNPMPPQPLLPKLCEAQAVGVYAARPFSNKTKASLELGGTEDLVMTAMTESGCFKVAERDKVETLIDEMKLCSDKQFFACDGFAKKGHLMGVTHFVFGDVVLFEPKNKGVDLGLKIPGLGGIDASLSYSALSANVRLVEVETGKVVTSKIVNAVIRDDQGGFAVSGQGFAFKAAAAYERTPAGNALKDMIAGAIRHFSTSPRS